MTRTEITELAKECRLPVMGRHEELEAFFHAAQKAERTPVAWLCVEADCISTSTYMRDHWLGKGKTVEPLYK